MNIIMEVNIIIWCGRAQALPQLCPCSPQHMSHRNVIRINSNGIEVLVTTLLLSDSYSLQLALLYRSPSVSLQCLINTLIDLFNQIDPVVPTILMGDFNVDLNENPNHLIRFMSNNSYDQLMDSPTTDYS